MTSVAASFDAADEAGELPLTPFFYLPSAITVDSAQIDASETWLAYVPGAALSSNDPQAFRDGTGVVPGWLARSLYVQQDDAGVWRFASSTEYSERCPVGGASHPPPISAGRLVFSYRSVHRRRMRVWLCDEYRS